MNPSRIKDAAESSTGDTKGLDNAEVSDGGPLTHESPAALAGIGRMSKKSSTAATVNRSRWMSHNSELEELAETRREKLEEQCKPWIKYGE